jgi:hypothetical protein
MRFEAWGQKRPRYLKVTSLSKGGRKCINGERPSIVHIARAKAPAEQQQSSTLCSLFSDPSSIEAVQPNAALPKNRIDSRIYHGGTRAHSHL